MAYPQDTPYDLNNSQHAVMEWLEFSDPDAPDERRFRVNITFMLSNYECIFGRGCPSIKPQVEGTRHDCGCCNQGAGYYGSDDVANVAKWFKKLTFKDMPEDKLRYAREHGWSVHNKDGEPYKTRKLNGACIFSNEKSDDPDAPAPGCAFHVLGQRLGVDHTEIKPEVCWTVPLLVETDGETTTHGRGPELVTITAQGRGEWGGTYPEDYTSYEQVTDNAYVGWWCVTEDTQCYTKRGWLGPNELMMEDTILSYDRDTGYLEWSPVRHILRKQNWETLFHIKGNGVDAKVTPEHRWVVQTDSGEVVMRRTDEMRAHDKLILMGEGVRDDHKIYTDTFAELVGWFVCEGSVETRGNHRRVTIYQQQGERADRIRSLLDDFGASYTESLGKGRNAAVVAFRLHSVDSRELCRVAPGKVMTADFIEALSLEQRDSLVQTMVDADGHEDQGGRRYFAQKDSDITNSFLSLCALAGYGTSTRRQQRTTEYGTYELDYVHVLKRNSAEWRNLKVERVRYEGQVWCPTTDYDTFVARRGGKVFVTGNCTDTPDAYLGENAAYVYFENELRKIMGDAAYEQMAKLLAAYGDRRSQMPGERVNDGNPTIGTIESLVASLKSKQQA